MATAAHLVNSLPQLSPDVAKWVDSVRELTQPRAVHWCDGSDAEWDRLTEQLREAMLRYRSLFGELLRASDEQASVTAGRGLDESEVPDERA